LPKAVESIVIERRAGKLFRMGLAEMNGWRPAMEDSHVAVMRDSWGFFGIFDGHGGSQCSAFVAKRLTEELSSGSLPPDDAAVKDLMLKIDREFLESGAPSGSTGTFAFVQPDIAGGRCRLRVGNIGDSRVLLGRADGSMVDGPGTDGGLTTDHKPDHPSEQERIERTGGTVQFVQGVARVNGDLAVSRAFGDAPHKETGGPRQEDHPVSAEPEFTTLECDANDFLVLVCDGISEGNFPNREVIELAAEQIREADADSAKADLGVAAAAVCRRALNRGSTDNLSCMLVQLRGGEAAGPHLELQPGPMVGLDHFGFRKAYGIMAERAGTTLAHAIEARYDAARKERVAAMARDSAGEDGQSGEAPGGPPHPAPLGDLRAEIALFGEGPPSQLAPGSEERRKWFEDWLAAHDIPPPPNPAEMSSSSLLNLLANDPDMLAAARRQGIIAPDAMREVEVAALEELRPAVEAHPALKWMDRLQALCGKRGRVLQDDPSDGTAQVSFPRPMGATAWLPASALRDVGETEAAGPCVLVCSEEQLRPVVEAHPELNWYTEMSEFCGQRGTALRVDEMDGTTQVRFPPPLDTTVWLPSSCLAEVESEEVELRRVVAPPLEHLRPAIEEHPVLKWHDRLADVCGKVGRVQQDDASDGTSQVRFLAPHRLTVWLPTDILRPYEEPAAPQADGPAPAEARGGDEGGVLAAELAVDAAGTGEPAEKRQKIE